MLNQNKLYYYTNLCCESPERSRSLIGVFLCPPQWLFMLILCLAKTLIARALLIDHLRRIQIIISGLLQMIGFSAVNWMSGLATSSLIIVT